MIFKVSGLKNSETILLGCDPKENDKLNCNVYKENLYSNHEAAVLIFNLSVHFK